MSRLAVALVALLVVMAGCSGLSGGNSPPDREPYGVDEQVNTPVEEEPEELLPGLTTEGVTNVREIRETHSETIGNRTYTIEYRHEYVVEENNKTFRQWSNMTIYIDPEAETVRQVNHRQIEADSPTADEPNMTIDQWFGEQQVTRTEFENGTVEYTPRRSARTGREQISRAEGPLFSPLGSDVETTVAGAVDAEDGTYYVINGSEHASGDDTKYGQDNRTVDMQGFIREDGLVRQTAVEDELVTEDGRRTAITQTTEITAIDNTTVERPDWYEDALEAQPEEPDRPDGERPTESGRNESPKEGQN